MKRFILAWYIILFFAPLYSQPNLDSLWQAWQDPSVGDSLRVVALYKYASSNLYNKPLDTLIHYSDELFLLAKRSHIRKLEGLPNSIRMLAYRINGEFDSASHYGKKNLQLYTEIDYPKGQVSTCISLGRISLYVGLFDEANTYYEKALKLSESNQLEQFIVPVLEGLGNTLLRKNKNKEAIDVFLQCKEKAIEIGNLNIAAGSLINIGLVYTNQDEYTPALTFLNQGVELCKKAGNRNFLANAYNNIGLVYYRLGDFAQAIHHYTLALKIREELGRQEEIAEAYQGIGLVYSEIHDIPKAKEYAREGLKIYQAINSIRGLAGSYINIGNLFRTEEKQDSALIYYEKGYRYAEQIKNFLYMRNAFAGMSDVYAQRNDLSKALEYQLKALQTIRQSSNKTGESYSLSQLASLYRKLGNLSLSISYGIQALEIAQEIDNKQTIIGAANTLYGSYRETGQSAKALEMFELATATEKEVQSEEDKRKIIRQEYQYEYEKQALQDSLANVQQQADTELAYQKRLSQRNYLLFGGLGLAVLIILFVRYQQQLRRQQAEAEAHRLAELDSVKTRLYTNITHEFRTPLTVIQGMANKVSDRPDRFLESGMRMIQRNSKQLLRLINQLLDLSKLESGHLSLNLQTVEIAPYLAYLVESFQSYAETQGLAISLNSGVEDLHMQTDPDRLNDILTNLLSNAIKFTPEGGQITVDTLRSGDRLQIAVRDTGKGIAPEQLPYVFDRFYQADDSATRQAEGTGVGLALVKELVQLMGGSISAESEMGKGSTFIVQLPISEATSKDVTIEPIVDREALLPVAALVEEALVGEDAPRILVVEDNADVARYLQTCLEGDYQVSWAKDGQQGINMAFEQVPDLVISDVMMPEKDGFEVCYALKHDLRTSHIPVILLTARADVDSKLTGLRQGADAYLSKPFDETELRIRIENLLAVRRNLQARYTQTEPEIEAGKPTGYEQEDAFISRFREVVMLHLDNTSLDVSLLSTELNLSRTPLHNKIKALTGMSTTEFVRHIRLHQAREMLNNPAFNVSEIAYATGFQSHTYFSRRFRELFEMTPKEWRER